MDPNSPFAAGDSDSSSETVLGTESGNPTGADPEPDVTLGTESGNPSDPSSTAPPEGEETGTESGNPTRPPPPTEGDVVSVPVPVPDEPEPTTNGVEPMAGAVPTEGGMTTAPPGSAVPDPTSPPDSMVPTGVAGEGACDPTTCEAEATAFAAALSTETPAPAPFSGASCSEASVCTCTRADGAVTLAMGEAGGCLVPGRLACLYATEEYEGCTLTDAACEAACSQVQARLETDAKGTPATVRASGCGTSGCVYVLSVGDACFFAGSALAPAEIDCSLSDEEALNSR